MQYEAELMEAIERDKNIPPVSHESKEVVEDKSPIHEAGDDVSPTHKAKKEPKGPAKFFRKLFGKKEKAAEKPVSEMKPSESKEEQPKEDNQPSPRENQAKEQDQVDYTTRIVERLQIEMIARYIVFFSII